MNAPLYHCPGCLQLVSLSLGERTADALAVVCPSCGHAHALRLQDTRLQAGDTGPQPVAAVHQAPVAQRGTHPAPPAAAPGSALSAPGSGVPVEPIMAQLAQRGAVIPPGLSDVVRRTLNTWSDQTAAAFVQQCQATDRQPLAGHLFSAVLAVRPGDAVAKAARDKLLAAAMANMQMTAPRKARKSTGIFLGIVGAVSLFMALFAAWWLLRG